MERYYESEGTWPGWYWMFVVEFVDPNRDPGVRTVAIYDSDWNYQYTVGSLVQEDIPIGEDEEGNIITVKKWVGRCPAGRQTVDPEDIYYSLLYASVIEGKMILLADQDKRQDYFWEFTEEGTP